ncbi:MAG: type II toxin-antitoxin system prevent-host-death family antitoxin [Candidatus Berkelbacteria bacterium]|nr:type II toxin-antitoxin system prevent-host-death family antitoxin [Candidatus Berkelbacteria bacterium]
MRKEKIKYININELQSNVSQIVKEANSGFVYKVMRYSKPSAVVLSNKGYEKILSTLNELQSACRKCVLHIDKFRRRK